MHATHASFHLSYKHTRRSRYRRVGVNRTGGHSRWGDVAHTHTRLFLLVITHKCLFSFVVHTRPFSFVITHTPLFICHYSHASFHSSYCTHTPFFICHTHTPLFMCHTHTQRTLGLGESSTARVTALLGHLLCDETLGAVRLLFVVICGCCLFSAMYVWYCSLIPADKSARMKVNQALCAIT